MGAPKGGEVLVTMPGVALLVVVDLMARSRLEQAAAAEGVATQAARRLGDPPASDPPALVVIDLDLPDALEEIQAWRERWPELPFVGFVSHVDVERSRAAREAGVTVVTRGETARRGREIFRSVVA